jgi:hypothetical protein
MKIMRYTLPFLFALLIPGVLASTTISDRDEIVAGEIPTPGHVWVYDFFATSSDIPAESALAGQLSANDPPQTADQISAGRKLGAEIGSELIKQFQAMGLQAGRATAETEMQINDVVVQGYLVSEVGGSEKKRVMIGFGAGGSELKAVVEGFQNTAQGLRQLGSAKTDSTEGTTGKTPGMAVGVIGTIATHNPLGLMISTGVKTHEEKSGGGTLEGRANDTGKKIADMLKQRFQELGWIEKTDD